MSLVRLPASRSRLGAKPQGGVLGLHRSPYRPHQVVAEYVQVRLVSELRQAIVKLRGREEKGQEEAKEEIEMLEQLLEMSSERE